MSAVNYSRRNFLRVAGVTGGGLVVGFSMSGCSSPAVLLKEFAGAFSPNAFLQITPDNVIRFYCPRDEMGQGVTTGLTTLVAEELDVAPWNMVVELASAHSDYANPDFGIQGTGGSTSMKAHFEQLRQVGADVRALILQAAAKDLSHDITQLSTNDGQVVVGGESKPYSDFLATAIGMALPTQSPLKTGDFKYMGQDFPRLDGIAKSTGTAVYGIDVDVPGMHYAVVKRSPVAGGTLQSVDSQTAESMPGVTEVLEIGSGVAVVAEKYWQAKKAAATLKLAWNNPDLGAVSTAQVKADYQTSMNDAEGESASSAGELEAAMSKAQTIVEQQYWAPYLAHAPMEPMNAVVRIENGQADVWSGTQGPGAAQGLVARYAGLDKEQVRVHQTYLGGGFGRRATLTHIIEATQVAVETGKPIHLLWSREDDIQHGIYRPASLMKIKAGVDEDGTISAWHAKRVGGNTTPDTLANMLPGVLPTAIGEGPIQWMVGMANSVFDGWVVDPTSTEGLFEDYDLPNHEVEHVSNNHGLPLTFWRSVGHSFTAFAKESMVEELALASGDDAIELRLKNTQNNPRLHNVITVAAQRMAAMQPAPGRSLGFAAHGSFGTDVAEIAEVSVQDSQIRVHKVTCVVDCGLVVNPDVVRAQMEGAIMYGLTAALYGNLELVNGAIKESNFHDYPILRMNEAPQVEVVLLNGEGGPTGVGEPGLPPIAPAVANAVFAATGQRLRSLPLKLA